MCRRLPLSAVSQGDVPVILRRQLRAPRQDGGIVAEPTLARVGALLADNESRLAITETGWGMPLQLWVQAARAGLKVREVGVPRLYLDPNRAFGGVLDDEERRLAYYRGVIDAADAECAARKAAAAPPTCCPFGVSSRRACP